MTTEFFEDAKHSEPQPILRYAYKKRWIIEKSTTNTREASFGSLVRVVSHLLLTSAVPLLQGAETVACCVSALGQYVPYYQTWYIEISSSITILTPCLGWTPVLHKEVVYMRPRTQAVRKPSLHVAGLQVHATTLSCR